VFQAVSVPCYGSGGVCGSSYQKITNNSTGGYNAVALEPFTIGGVQYVAEGNSAGYYSKIFQWMTGTGASPCSTTPGGLGDGTTCGRPIQYLQTLSGDTPYDITPYSVGGNNYIAYGTYNGSQNVTTYKWGSNICPIVSEPNATDTQSLLH
jgi:hypothetical protein